MSVYLPPLDSAELLHTQQLQEIICQEIDQLGPITFARYMELALYEPSLGYYCSDRPKFGVAGDFTTAPEQSSLLAACLAKRCIPLFETTAPFILEVGAGSGILALELLLTLDTLHVLPEHYFLMERSPFLVAQQQKLISLYAPHLLDRMTWVTDWPDFFNGVVIANELFDAMPVHRFVMKQEIEECYVTHERGVLTWHRDVPRDDSLITQWTNYHIHLDEGYTSEINLALPGWIARWAQSVNQVYAFFIDYGYERDIYYHPERHMGTLMCHFKQHAHANPLLYPGVQDITAYVDFTLLAESAIATGFEVQSFNTQAQFLIASGITELLENITDDAQRMQYTQQAKQLLLPGYMGEAFKVIELVKK